MYNFILSIFLLRLITQKTHSLLRKISGRKKVKRLIKKCIPENLFKAFKKITSSFLIRVINSKR